MVSCVWCSLRDGLSAHAVNFDDLVPALGVIPVSCRGDLWDFCALVYRNGAVVGVPGCVPGVSEGVCSILVLLYVSEVRGRCDVGVPVFRRGFVGTGIVDVFVISCVSLRGCSLPCLLSMLSGVCLLRV